MHLLLQQHRVHAIEWDITGARLVASPNSHTSSWRFYPCLKALYHEDYVLTVHVLTFPPFLPFLYIMGFVCNQGNSSFLVKRALKHIPPIEPWGTPMFTSIPMMHHQILPSAFTLNASLRTRQLDPRYSIAMLIGRPGAETLLSKWGG